MSMSIQVDQNLNREESSLKTYIYSLFGY